MITNSELPDPFGADSNDGVPMSWTGRATEAERTEMGDPQTLELRFDEELDSIKGWIEKQFRDRGNLSPRLLFYVGGVRQYFIGLRNHEDERGHHLALTETLLLARAAGISEVVVFAAAQMREASVADIHNKVPPKPDTDGTRSSLSLYVAAFGPKGTRFALLPFHLHGQGRIHWGSEVHDTGLEPRSAADLSPYQSVTECVAAPLAADEALSAYAVRLLRGLGHEVTVYIDDED